MTLSIVIVNYNTEALLADCIASLYTGANGMPFDVWVVDNDSRDNSVEMVRSRFPQVKLIVNEANIGFSKANNKVISQTESDYILLLNPDTLILNDAIDTMVKLMDDHPGVGIAGCKVLNEDRTLQLACRRSIPTPGSAFFRLTGLSRLFPKNRMLAKYNLTYNDPDTLQEVDAVSGAFLMIRRRTIEQIGLLDEQFFMYGEELDWCLRAKRAGWTVMYCPTAEIVHFKGASARSNSRKATVEFYRAMYLFYRKHFARDSSAVINALVYAGIFFRALFSWRGFIFRAKPGSGRVSP
jgi:GT2 family glycosyltransferase